MLQRNRSRRFVAAVLACCGLAALGCSGSSPEAALPPQSLVIQRPAEPAPPAVEPLERAAAPADGSAVATPAEGQPTAAPVAPPPPIVAAPRASSSARQSGDDTVVVVDRSDEAGREDMAAVLRGLSRQERERRQKTPPARLVLTDENLSASAEGARVTFSGPAVAATRPDGAPEREPGFPDDLEEGAEEERYWRSRTLEVRQRWRRAHDEVPRLEDEVEQWRTAFYAEDDPVRRDRQVKPLWDRALDRLLQSRDEVVQAQEDLELLLEEGRAAGALPGWLREGIELEPAPSLQPPEGEGLEETDPEEPITVEPLSREPPAR
ncbi:MAG TPA: hypothetical protein VNB06_15085 [Thermoanaerobaculia bacterium]|nr:hypothetical protein [Thermoanaerobaculia bacterium]